MDFTKDIEHCGTFYIRWEWIHSKYYLYKLFQIYYIGQLSESIKNLGNDKVDFFD